MDPEIKTSLEEIKKRIKQKVAKGRPAFWFVRHGESEGNVLGRTCPVMHDTPLTAKGTQEAAQIISYLQQNSTRVTHIYASPKERSLQTAEIIAASLGLEINVKPGLDERDWGEWSALYWHEASDRLDQMPIQERYTFTPEGGESWEKMEERLFLTLEEIAEESKGGKNVLIITHRGCLRALMPTLAKAGISKHKEFSVATGTLSKFSFDKDRFDFVGFLPRALSVFFALFSSLVH
ncbi:histidine phosphatase family protein [Candidatus Kaiserbacteria bacterium]|nr:histidine phosphatase family protein [Candidatus Kaiserbacteria bacterium]